MTAREEDFFGLAGKTAVVTGAAGGLGRELALGLASRGAYIVLADFADAGETLELIECSGGEGVYVGTDVTDEKSVSSLAAETERLKGRADVLVNCAGVVQHGFTPSEDLPLDEWERVLKVNLTGTFLMCRELGKLMLRTGGGRIINIASSAAKRGIPRQPAYCASKAGVELLTKSLAVEWAGRGVYVNAVAPHYLETGLTENVLKDEKVHKALTCRIPLGRFGKTSEVLGAVLLLASPGGSYMTGTAIDVDGGFSA